MLLPKNVAALALYTFFASSSFISMKSSAGLSLLGICTPLDQSEQRSKWLSVVSVVVTLSRLGKSVMYKEVTNVFDTHTRMTDQELVYRTIYHRHTHETCLALITPRVRPTNYLS